MREKRKPPVSLAGDRAAEGSKRADILADTDDRSKQGCASPAIVAAWRRWRSAVRVAVHAIRGPQ